jgi:hypothetical protein
LSKKTPYITELATTTDAAGVAQLRTNRLRRGETLYIQTVSVRSPTTANVLAHIGVLRGNNLYRIDSVPMAAALSTYPSFAFVVIESDAQLQIDFTAGGNAQLVEAWVYGYIGDAPLLPVD